jgi:hypothetical protein
MYQLVSLGYQLESFRRELRFQAIEEERNHAWGNV